VKLPGAASCLDARWVGSVVGFGRSPLIGALLDAVPAGVKIVAERIARSCSAHRRARIGLLVTTLVAGLSLHHVVRASGKDRQRHREHDESFHGVILRRGASRAIPGLIDYRDGPPAHRSWYRCRSASGQEGDHEKDDGDTDEEVSDLRRQSGDTLKAENCGDQSDDEEH